MSGLAAVVVQGLMALDVSPGASSISPGTEHAGISQPSDPYLGAPGHEFAHNAQPGDPYRAGNPYRNAPGLLINL